MNNVRAENVKKIREIAESLASEATATRRHLHRHPEISWQEVETSKFIARELTKLGLEDIRLGFGGTESGVTADLVGDAAGPCVALRADIDALPLAEENMFDYRSCNDGAMHACGHDGHIATLLGTARLLSRLKGELPGRVRFIFQPAEENGAIGSGARAMIADGVLNGVNAIAGMHLWSFVPTGRVQWKNGPVMASVDGWHVTYTGRGGHGAMPHEAIDPTVAAANFVGALQTVVSRELNPVDTAVVSIGRMHAGDAFNIIPNTVEISGSIRSFNPAVREKMASRIGRIVDGIAAAYRCTAETTVNPLYPSVVNHPGVTAALLEAAVAVVGAENVEESPLLMVSEDFSYYQEQVPGTFFFLGAGSAEKGTDYPHHSPRFNIDDDALPIGMTIFSTFAFDMLEKLRLE